MSAARGDDSRVLSWFLDAIVMALYIGACGLPALSPPWVDPDEELGYRGIVVLVRSPVLANNSELADYGYPTGDKNRLLLVAWLPNLLLFSGLVGLAARRYKLAVCLAITAILLLPLTFVVTERYDSTMLVGSYLWVASILLFAITSFTVAGVAPKEGR